MKRKMDEDMKMMNRQASSASHADHAEDGMGMMSSGDQEEMDDAKKGSMGRNAGNRMGKPMMENGDMEEMDDAKSGGGRMMGGRGMMKGGRSMTNSMPSKMDMDEEVMDDERGGKRIGLRGGGAEGGRVEMGGGPLSTGKGPHTMAQPKGDMGASVAGVGEARKAEMPHVTGGVSREHDMKMTSPGQGGKTGEGSSMSGVGEARMAQSRHQKADMDEQLGEHKMVSSGRGMKRQAVDADHVIGDGGEIGMMSAEGMADMASSRANRKEAMEPEREMDEKMAMGRERTPPTKNTMGWGERETIAKHTI